MTEQTPASNIQSLDALLAAIRTGMDPAELSLHIKRLIQPSHDHRWPVPWFRWCREAITADAGGTAGERWLDLDEPLEPLQSVARTLTRLAPHDRWIVAALRLAKLARDVSDTVHGGATPEEHAGFAAIVKQLGLAEERAALWDLYCDYRELSRPVLAQCHIALPLMEEGTAQGVLGELRLALVSEGTGQLYRAHNLAFVKVAPEFSNAGATALAALAQMGRALPENRDLRWEVRIRATGAVPLELTGASCGGAFALGMQVLLAGDRADPRTGTLGPLHSEELSGIAVTATVDAQGMLGPISGEVLKLQAAARERVLPRIHTFVVAANQPGLDQTLDDPHAELCVKRAEKVADAEGLLVRELRRRGFDRACILDYHAELQRHTALLRDLSQKGQASRLATPIPTTLSLTTQKANPQWADYRDYLVEAVPPWVLRCQIATESPYFRFGFKLLLEGGRVFGDGAINSYDANMLVHIGRNNWDRPALKITARDIFLAAYMSGSSIGENDIFLFQSEPKLVVPIELTVDRSYCAMLSVNGQLFFRQVVPPAMCRRVALYAWGDREEFQVDVMDLAIKSI